MTPRWQRLATWLLSARLSAAQQEELLGDLAEDFAARRRARGRVRAWAWLLWEVASLRHAYRGPRVRRPFVETLMQDVRLGSRLLRRDPGFTAIALCTLTLSIGANTLMFSVIDGALLRPLAYPDADRLVAIAGATADRALTGLNVSFTKLTYLQQRSHSLMRVGAYAATGTSMTTNGLPEQFPAARVTGNFFDVLGVVPEAGRGFLDREDREGGDDVAIITDGLWRSRFGADTAIVGRQVRLDGRSVTIVGVLPSGFHCPCQEPAPEVWFPRVFENPMLGPERVRLGASYLVAMARLQPGQTTASAQAELDALNESYGRQFPGFADALITLDADSLQENLVGPLRPSLLVLWAAVGFVLLIGCSNIASMLLARATTRAPEIAVRRAMGASRGRLMRQLLTESLLLSLCGGLLGLVAASGGLRLLLLLPVGVLPRVSEMHLNGRVLAFSFVLCGVAGLACGLVPALRVSRNAIQDALKEGGRGSREGRRSGRARGVLVVAEVALAVVLVTCAGLLVRSFAALVRMEPGFTPKGVMTFSVSLPTSRYPQPGQQSEFYRRLVEETARLPGVESAAVSTFLPLGGQRYVYFCPEGAVCLGIGRDPVILQRQITPDYFRTMRIHLVKGRAFDDHDDANAEAVAIINATTASRYFPNQDPIGKSLMQSRGDIKTRIVGVVADVRSRGVNTPYAPEMFLPQRQSPAATMSLVVRADGPVQPLVGAVRAAVAALDRDVPLSNVVSMEEIVSVAVAQPRLTAQLTGVFALMALLLSAIGIYGVLAYTVSQRTHEIGMRLALGAVRRDVVTLVLGQSARLVVTGIVIGSALSLGATRLLSALLVETSARDPITFAGVALLLVTVALVASYVPARRAARVEPIVALRG